VTITPEERRSFQERICEGLDVPIEAVLSPTGLFGEADVGEMVPISLGEPVHDFDYTDAAELTDDGHKNADRCWADRYSNRKIYLGTCNAPSDPRSPIGLCTEHMEKKQEFDGQAPADEGGSGAVVQSVTLGTSFNHIEAMNEFARRFTEVFMPIGEHYVRVINEAHRLLEANLPMVPAQCLPHGTRWPIGDTVWVVRGRRGRPHTYHFSE
jgi:hypothetical protein